MKLAAFFKDIKHAGVGGEREDSDTVNSEASSSIVSDQSLADTLTPEEQAGGVHLRSSSDQCPPSVDCYLEECKKYGIQPNPGVLVALRFQLRAMRPTAKFHCRDLMPLAEVLIKHGKACEHVKVADFSHARLQSHGAIVLSRILQHVKWEKIELQNNPIGGHGAKALAAALAHCETVKHLGLRRCCIGTAGASAIAAELLEKEGNKMLSFLDLSTNHTGLQGVVRVKRSLVARKSAVSIRMEGNIVLAEILSSVTHGVGALLSLIGSSLLMNRASKQSSTHQVAAGVYAASLVLLYITSTLYHSFFMLYSTQYVFHILDQCAIYVLIAGSYTPVLAVTLHAQPHWSQGLLSFMWVVCVCGLFHTSCNFGPYKGKISLLLYLLMGWAALICIQDVSRTMPAGGLWWMVTGGVIYTAGVPFFALDRDPSTSMLHVIWHIFVMAGSFAHWWMVFEYVMPFPLPQR